MHFRILLIFAAFFLPFVILAQKPSKHEKALIRSGNSDEKLYVLQSTISNDLSILRKTAEPISKVRKGLWKKLANRMLATVNDPMHQGVGIAAPQVGISRRLIVVQRFDKPGQAFQVVLNPEIVSSSDSTWKMAEGCLSIPGLRDTISRPWQISLRYQDINGKQFTETVCGFTARIFQHETDHLNGILITDYNHD